MLDQFQQLKVQFEIKRLKVLELQQAKEELEIKLKNLQNQLNDDEKSLTLLKACLEKLLEKKIYIEDLISKALTTVFNKNYKCLLELQYDSDGILKGIKPKFAEEDGEFDDPISSFGSGAAAIASLCLRIAILLITGGTAPVLVMDEPLANLSSDLQPTMQKFIEETCKASDLQLVMITHLDEPFGKVYRVSKHSGISTCIISN